MASQKSINKTLASKNQGPKQTSWKEEKKLLKTWQSCNVPLHYQKMVLRGLDRKTRKVQEKQIVKQIQKTINKTSQYFAIVNLVTKRGNLTRELVENLQPFQIDEDTDDIQDEDLEEVCRLLQSIRNINLLITEELMKTIHLFDVKKEQVSDQYLRLVREFDQDFSVLKDTHLREILPFAEDFDPFLVEPVHKMTQKKKQAFEHESVSQLFSFSPSYIFRLLKAKKNIIELLSGSPSPYSSVISQSTVSPVNERRDLFSSGISSPQSKFKESLSSNFAKKDNSKFKQSLSSKVVKKDKSEINNKIYLGEKIAFQNEFGQIQFQQKQKKENKVERQGLLKGTTKTKLQDQQSNDSKSIISSLLVSQKSRKFRIFPQVVKIDVKEDNAGQSDKAERSEYQSERWKRIQSARLVKKPRRILRNTSEGQEIHQNRLNVDKGLSAEKKKPNSYIENISVRRQKYFQEEKVYQAKSSDSSQEKIPKAESITTPRKTEVKFGKTKKEIAIARKKILIMNKIDSKYKRLVQKEKEKALKEIDAKVQAIENGQTKRDTERKTGRKGIEISQI